MYKDIINSFDDISNEIIENLSNKITNYAKDLYNQVVNDLSHQLPKDEINKGFKNALTTEYNLKEIAQLNISELNFIKDLKIKNEPLSEAYTNYLADNIISKVYKNLNKEIFTKKPSLKNKIEAKKDILNKAKESQQDIKKDKQINNIKTL